MTGVFLGMCVKLDIVTSSDTLEALLAFSSDVIDSYINNPYHNYEHAFDVTFMVFHLIYDLGVLQQMSLTRSECVALFIAALGHDMAHPGVNNLYQVYNNRFKYRLMRIPNWLKSIIIFRF